MEVVGSILRLNRKYTPTTTVNEITSKIKEPKPSPHPVRINMRNRVLTRVVQGQRVPRFRMATSLLTANKQVYAEAIRMLRLAPLVVDQHMLNVLKHYYLTIAHFIPFRSLKNVERIHFHGLSDPSLAVKTLLWAGDRLSADINQGDMAISDFPGMLKAAEKSPSKLRKSIAKPKQLNAKLRHPDTHPEGEYAVSKLSFETMFDVPRIVDLARDHAVRTS